MRIVISDITGRTLNYDYALCESISQIIDSEDTVEFWGPKYEDTYDFAIRSSFSIVPSRFKASTNILVRILKAFDCIIAYIRLCIYILKFKPSIFHLQWLPFLSLGTKGANIDLFFLTLIKKLSSNTKMVFTIHNMCPHGMSEGDRVDYNPVFSNALKLFDHFVVHTEVTKNEVVDTFCVNSNQVTVVHHGVFVPKNVTFTDKQWDSKKVKLIMYGSQNWYKGTDIFLQALAILPDEYKQNITVSICGSIDSATKAKCSMINTNCDIEWMPFYLDDDLLYSQINSADIILLPYRRISQSGVLLLALATKRLIITSDLPTFKETLSSYDNDMFFESENPQSLSDLLCRFLSGEIDRDKLHYKLENLSNLYSWKESAQKTLKIYNFI